MEKELKALVELMEQMNEKMTSMEKSLREIRVRLTDGPEI